MFTSVVKAVWMSKMYLYCVIFAFLLHFSNSESTTEGVRLEGGKSQMEGRVEIWFNGQWWKICDDHWGFKEATVICRQLDLGLFGWVELRPIFGKGSGPVWSGRMSCDGSEKSITDCDDLISDSEEWNQCGHSYGVGVICTSEMRLNGSESSKEGYLEIYSERKKQWAFVKEDSLLDQDIVIAVCRHLELGMEGTLVPVHESSSDAGSGLESLQDIVFGTPRDPLPVISCFGDINACVVENPCSPNGECIHEVEGNTLSCSCFSGFTGLRCEEAVTKEVHINVMVLIMVMIPLVLLVAALLLAVMCVVSHHRKRIRNAMVLDNGFPTTAKTSGKHDNEYLSLLEK